MSSPAAEKKTFSEKIPHLDLTITDPLERVKAFLEFAALPTYNVPPLLLPARAGI